MMEIKIDITDGASADLRKAIAALSGEQSAHLNEQGGRAAVNAAIDYHRGYEASNKWRGKNYMGAVNGPRFGESVASGWHFLSSDKDGATIFNDAAYFRHKVNGGTILPKGGRKALTIPMIPEARGKNVAEYVDTYGKKLFTIKGKKAIFEAKEGGGIRAVYALVKSVTQGPWPGALPPDDRLADAFLEKYREALIKILP